VGASGISIGPKYFANVFHVHHETRSKAMEIKGTRSFRLRHHTFWFHKNFGGKTIKVPCGNFKSGRVQNFTEKINFGSNPSCPAPGFHNKSCQRPAGGASTKIKNDSKRNWQSPFGKEHDMSKDGKHFGPDPKPFGGSSISQAGDSKTAAFQPKLPSKRLGPFHPHSTGFKGRNQKFETIFGARARTTFFATSKAFSAQRQLNVGMGGSGLLPGNLHPRFLEGTPHSPHQRKGVDGCSLHHSQFCKTWGNCPTKCGQPGGHDIPPKVGRTEGASKQNSGTPVQVLLGKVHSIASPLGAQRENGGGPLDSLESRSRGLHLVSHSFPKNSQIFQQGHFSKHRHVCKPRKCQIPKICDKIPTLPSFSGGRTKLQLGGSGGGLRQSPLESCHALVGSVTTQQKASLPVGVSYVGFKSMVAPVNQNVQAKNKAFGHPSEGGNVSELLGRINASSKMAPGFSDCFRFLLEQQQIDHKEINLALKNLGNVSRYEKPFKKLFAVLQEKHVHPLKAKIVDVATGLLLLSEISVAEARNAYAAVCLLPGFEGIRFSPVLKGLKRTWNHSVQKYGTFWDPQPILRKLQTERPLSSFSVSELRNRLILVFRLLALHRGIDLARTQRTISVVGDKHFILVQRKGWKAPRWEQVAKMDDEPSLSPFHVMAAYVNKTAPFVPPGGPLL
jgi:hypothetical protein